MISTSTAPKLRERTKDNPQMVRSRRSIPRMQWQTLNLSGVNQIPLCWRWFRRFVAHTKKMCGYDVFPHGEPQLSRPTGSQRGLPGFRFTQSRLRQCAPAPSRPANSPSPASLADARSAPSPASGRGKNYAANVSFTAATSCLSVNGLAKNPNWPLAGRCFWKASSA